MMASPLLHSVASVAFERLLYCLAEGTVLAMVLALSMRLVPEKSSHTKFAIWFSALLASVFLPLISLGWGGEATSLESRHSLITLPVSFVLWIFLGWMTVACIGLVRVGAGVVQLRRLRKGCIEADQQLNPEVAGIVSGLRRVRPVSVLVSGRIRVPTAVGFFKPAVLIPAWMMEEGDSDELKHVMLHELAHLRRRDDWTNLIQKVVKAVLFFHPGVWWMERELSLEREMACDDAVLEQTASPRRYAECLARVAEKSFVRRQIVLAQAAVSRMRHLTSRVTRILDPNRRPTTQFWKPAIPGVAVLAVVSGVFGLWAPGLVKVDDGQKLAAQSARPADAAFRVDQQTTVAATTSLLPRSWPAGLKEPSSRATGAHSLYVPARHTIRPAKPAKSLPTQVKMKQQKPSPMVLAQYSQRTPDALWPVPTQQEGEYVLVIETRQTVTAGANGWQLSVQQLRWLVPVSRLQKQAPNKI